MCFNILSLSGFVWHNFTSTDYQSALRNIPEQGTSYFVLTVLFLVVTLCTTRFNIQKCYVQPTQCIHAFILCGSQNRQRLFPYTALTGWP